MVRQVKWKRRQFMTTIAGVSFSLPLLSLSPLLFNSQGNLKNIFEREERVIAALLKNWTIGWPPLTERPLENDLIKVFDQVIELIRKDKRADLLFALKLLSYGPSCFFLTGKFNPWEDTSDTEIVVKRWANSEKEIESTLYMAFTALFSASYYSQKQTWTSIGYPGPPEVDRSQFIKGDS